MISFYPRSVRAGLLVLFLTLIAFYSSAQNISTVAGVGTSSFSGDGGLATAAELAQPVDVARDGSGNIYICDQGNHRIRKVTYSTGNISTVAGSSTSGFSGDGGAATSAKLYYPSGIAVDGSGNIYIADQGNHRIRKVTASTGVISTIAGTGISGFSGDGGSASSAQLANPVAVAVDGSGNVYISDQYNQRIRKITASTGTISTIAGTGTYSYSGDGSAATSATFQNPAGLSVDASGNIFIADLFNHVIRKITASTGVITTVAGSGTAGYSGDGGVATSASLNYPTDVSFDDSGNIYIAVQYSHRIRKVSAATGNISTIIGTGTAGYSGDGGPATSAQVNYPTGIVSDGGGNLYVADRENHRIRFVCNYLVKPTVSSPVNYCVGATATALSATGTSLKWFTVPVGGIGSTTAPIPSTASAGTTKYYVASISPYGCEGPRDSISVVVSDLPAAPAVTSPVTYCVGAAASALSATGTGLKWYTTATGGAGTTTAPTPSTTSAGTTTYYVSQTSATTGCESPRASISVVVNALPAAPTVSSPVTYCEGATATSLSATGSSLLWYTAASGGTGISTAPVPSTASAGTTTYYVSQTTSCGESSRASITVNVNAKPAAPTVSSPVAYCQYATATALTATGTSLKWYTTATGGTGTTSLTPSTATAGSTTYYVSQTSSSTGCESDRASITVTVSAAPATPTVTSPLSYCVGEVATALSATGTSLKWYTVATGGTGSTTTPIPSTTSAGTTIYYVSQTSTGGCEGLRASIIVTVNPLPAAPVAASPVNLCEGVTATALSATGTSLKWYTVATGGTASTAAPTPATTSTGTTTYYVSQTTSCGESARTAITVNVNPVPSAPSVVSPLTYCQGDTGIAALTASGTNLKWYTTATGGSGSSTAPAPSTTTAGTFIFYVSQTNSYGCESPRSSISVKINVAPPAPLVATPVIYCVGATAVPLTATGTGLTWYTVPYGGIGTTTAPTPSTATPGSFTWYVSQTDTSSCPSLRAAITVTVYANPAAPTVTSPVNYCEGATTTALTAGAATGDTLKWYTVVSGGTPSLTAPTPSSATASTTTYYVSATSRYGCGEGTRSSITVNINAKPSAPSVVSPVSYCVGATATALSATGTGLKWYTTRTGGTALGAAPTPSTSSVGTTKYYVSQTNVSGCESTRDSITVTINSVPSAPTVTSPVAYCVGASASALTATGSSLKWYTVSSGGTASTSAPVPSTAAAGTTTYYVSQTSAAGCESPRASITVNVATSTGAPVATSPVNYCVGATAAALSATGTGLLWYTDATGGTGSTAAPVPSTATVGSDTFYVTQTVTTGGCGESPRAAVVVNVNPVPAAPAVPSATVAYCAGDTATTLSATGTSLKWYTVATGGIASTTAPTPSTTTAGVTSYYVSQTNASGCEGPRTSITVTINATPAAPTVSSPVEYCSNAVATALTATGTSLKWYTTATGGTGSTTAPVPGTASTGTTSYYVTQTSTGGCESPRAEINVIVYATPTAPTVGFIVTLCHGGAAGPLTATGSGLKWYTTATGGAGATTAPTPSTTTTGATYYYVSQTSSSGCEGPRAAILVNVDTLLAAPVVTSPVVYCQGATASALSATGTSLRWYKDTRTGPYTTTAPVPNTSVADTITYYVNRVSSAGCEGYQDSIIVYINPLPALPTVTSPVVYCEGASSVALSATGTGLKWYTASTGGTALPTAPVPSTTAAGSTTYYVSQTSAASCEGPRAAITVTVNAIPAAPAVTSPVAYCQDAVASALTATGTGLKWYTVATGGIGSTTAPTPLTTSAGSTTYYVSQTTAAGCEGPRAFISVVVNPTPAKPSVVSPVTYCIGEPTVPLTATGTSLKWYTVATGGTASTTAPTPSSASSSTITYFVSQTSSFGCESLRDSIQVIVNSILPPPVVSSPINYCVGATTTALTATGSSLKWYTVATGGTASTTAPVPSSATAGTTTWYVSQTSASGCEGTRASIAVNINALPSSPTVTSPVSYCQGATASALSATGTSLKWYTAATGGTGSTTAPTPVTTATGSTKYYVSQTNAAGCEGPRDSITVTINPLPAAPTVSTPVSYCQGAAATALTATGTSLKWYTAATGGTGTTTAPTPATTTAGSTKYYVSQTNAFTCEGPRDSITVTINPLPAAPTVTTPVEYCVGATATALTATGSSLKWYTVSTGGTGSSTAPVPSTVSSGTTTYYVSQTNTFTCEGPRASIVVNINALPAAPVVTTPVSYCEGATATALTATGTSLKWYTAATGGTGSTTAPVPATATSGSTVYYVSQTSGAACEGPRAAITVTVNALPAAPLVVTPVSYCQDAVAAALTATGTSLKWYTAATGGTGSTTAPTPSTTTAGTTVYYVSQTSGLTCEGPRAAISVVINPTPAAPTVVTPIGYCTGATALPLTATGTSLKWYTTATGGTGSTTAPTPSTAVTGSTAYYVSQTSVDGCESPRAKLEVEVTNIPDVTIIPVGAPTYVYCKRDSVLLRATSPVALSAYQWYKNGTLLPGATGSELKAYENGNYKVEVTNAYGCKGDATVYVFGDTLPEPILSPVDLQFCPNVNIVLFCKPASPRYKYEWFKDGVFMPAEVTDKIITNKAGDYHIRVTDSFGCVTITNHSIITTYPVVPRPTIIRADPVLRLSRSYVSHQWYRNGKALAGATGVSYTMPFTGVYWCEVFDINGCATMSDTVDTQKPMSISNRTKDSKLKIYPNPTQAKVWLEADFPVDVRVTDVAGRLIETRKDAKEIDLEPYADGVYIFTVFDQDGQLLDIEKIDKLSGGR